MALVVYWANHTEVVFFAACVDGVVMHENWKCWTTDAPLAVASTIDTGIESKAQTK